VAVLVFITELAFLVDRVLAATSTPAAAPGQLDKEMLVALAHQAILAAAVAAVLVRLVLLLPVLMAALAALAVIGSL
jgi:hypothetical protein